MAIHSPHLFKRRLPAGFDGEFHWDWVSAAVQRATGRNIEPMDIDAHVEINGQFLIFETKEPGNDVPLGQRRALLGLWARGYVTLVFLWGKKTPIHAEIFYPAGRRATIRATILGANGSGNSIDHDWGRSDFEKFVEDWARFAEKNACPFLYNGTSGEAA